jgi:hypothetical protein
MQCSTRCFVVAYCTLELCAWGEVHFFFGRVVCGYGTGTDTGKGMGTVTGTDTDTDTGRDTGIGRPGYSGNTRRISIDSAEKYLLL